MISWSELESTVATSQDVYIQDLLGSSFYNYLLGVYAAATWTADEEILLAKIRVALAFRTAEQVSPFIALQFKNKGILKQSGEFAQSADLSEVKYVRSELRNRAEFYETRITKYLCENSTLFPQYTAPANTSNDMPPRKGDSNYNFGGLQFWF